jgi:hypothetical protein
MHGSIVSDVVKCRSNYSEKSIQVKLITREHKTRGDMVSLNKTSVSTHLQGTKL